LFRYALGRDPSIDELTEAIEFIDRGGPADAATVTQPLTRWQEFAQVLLMSNEFMFVD
jgi:hypothetical protein